MKTNQTISKTKALFGKAAFRLKKHSPEILITAGVIGVVTSAILACRATLKLGDILEEGKESIDAARENMEGNTTEQSHDDAVRELVAAYAEVTVKVARIYTPPIILGSLSLGCIIASNNILRKRNAALAAAYAIVDTGFKEYRARVAERFGDDVDRSLKYGGETEIITTTITDEEGNEKTVESLIHVVDPNTYSTYARFFDDGNEGWEKDPELNLMFLRRQQQYANDLLIAKGHLFLNEVYDMLGIPRSKAGQVVGWVYNSEHDNYVDFGIYTASSDAARKFVNGHERSILLDFNVDGYILDSF